MAPSSRKWRANETGPQMTARTGRTRQRREARSPHQRKRATRGAVRIEAIMPIG
jgi:hypothetical protein